MSPTGGARHYPSYFLGGNATAPIKKKQDAFIFKIKLEKIENTSLEFNAENTNMWPTKVRGDNVCCFLWGKTIALKRGEARTLSLSEWSEKCYQTV